jgi:hypothetical protein
MKTKIIFSVIVSTLIIGIEAKAQTTTWNLVGNALTAPTQFLGTTNPYDLYFKAAGIEQMRISQSTGNISISKNGISTFSFGKLNVNAAITLNNTADNLVGLSLEKQINASYARRLFFIPHCSGGVSPLVQSGDVGMFWTDGGNGVAGSGNKNAGAGLVIASHSDGSNGIRITSSGNVGIGVALVSNPNNYKLAVNGILGARAVKVEVSVWSDYVFNKEYKLKTLPELEAFVKANHHLPNIPSTAEVEKDGIDMATMDAKLLEKIEELSLYIIEQNKHAAEQDKRIELLEKMITKQN